MFPRFRGEGGYTSPPPCGRPSFTVLYPGPPFSNSVLLKSLSMKSRHFKRGLPILLPFSWRTHAILDSLSTFIRSTYPALFLWIFTVRHFYVPLLHQIWSTSVHVQSTQDCNCCNSSWAPSRSHMPHHDQVPSFWRRWAVMTLHCSRSWASFTRSSYRIPVHSVIFVIHSVLGLPLLVSPYSGRSNISPRVSKSIFINKSPEA